MGDASEVSPSAPSPVTEVLSAHVKDAQNTPIVPLKSDAVSKDQAQGNGDSDFKATDFIAPDSKVVSQVSKKGKSSSKKNLGPENKPTEQEKVDRNPKKEQEESSDHKKSKEASDHKKSKEAGQVKKGKETDEGEKSKAVKESIDFIAESGVELAIEATAEPTPTKPELNMSSVTDPAESTRSGEEQKSVDVAVTHKNKSDDAAQKTVSVDAAWEIKSVDIALMNKPAENMPMNKSAKEKKDNVYADAIVASQEGVFGKSFVASKPVEKTSFSEAVAKKSESADLKNGTESVEDILNVEKKATDVKEVVGAKKGTNEVEVKGAQAEGILNVDQLTSLVKEALDIKKEVGEEKDKASSAVK